MTVLQLWIQQTSCIYQKSSPCSRHSYPYRPCSWAYIYIYVCICIYTSWILIIHGLKTVKNTQNYQNYQNNLTWKICSLNLSHHLSSKEFGFGDMISIIFNKLFDEVIAIMVVTSFGNFGNFGNIGIFS